MNGSEGKGLDGEGRADVNGGVLDNRDGGWRCGSEWVGR
jgi:hypothetical protein